MRVGRSFDACVQKSALCTPSCGIMAPVIGKVFWTLSSCPCKAELYTYSHPGRTNNRITSLYEVLYGNVEGKSANYIPNVWKGLGFEDWAQCCLFR